MSLPGLFVQVPPSLSTVNIIKGTNTKLFASQTLLTKSSLMNY